MHPLDLSPRTSSSRSTYSSSKSSSKNVEYNIHQDISRKSKLGNKREQDQGKRGRPRADILTTLMVAGSSSRSKIRCIKCGRAFPREKSLQAHVRTHTGEKPYSCDFPGCSKAFCQSGQLKTHQRLHTGEKPFACIIEGCENRFTHANRRCNSHPYAGLKRLELNWNQVAKLNEGQSNAEVKQWIERYIWQSKERLSTKKPSSHESPPSEQVRPQSPVKIQVQGHTFNHRKADQSPPVKSQPVQDEKISPLDLTRNNRSPSLPKLSPIHVLPASPTYHHSAPPPLIPIIPHFSNSASTTPTLVVHTSNPPTPSTNKQSYQSSSPVFYPSSLSSLSSPNARSVSSSSSFSASSSTTSSSSSTSIPTLYRHNNIATLSAPDKRTDECYPYVFSSQMILQGHSTLHGPYFSHCFPFHSVTHTPTTTALIEHKNKPIKPKDKEKDRYISALALIELSKG